MSELELRIETVFGFENVVSKLLNNDLDDAFKAASMLSMELGLEDPITAYQSFDVAKNLVNAPYLVRAEAMKSLGIKPTIGYEDTVKLFFKLKYQALRDIFVFLHRARKVIEDAFGMPLYNLVNPTFTDQLFYRSTGTVLAQGSEQPSFQNAIITCVLHVLLGLNPKKAIKLLKLSLLHECYLHLAKHGPKLKRSIYVAMFMKYSIQYGRMQNMIRAFMTPYLRALDNTETQARIEYVLPPQWLHAVAKKLPAPFLVVERRAWATGVPVSHGTVNLNMPDFPYKSEASRPLLAAILAVTGSGKTTLLNSLALYMLERNSFGVRLEVDVDDRMQGQLMALPLHREHSGIRELQFLGMEPRGLVVPKHNSTKEEVEKSCRDPNVLSLMIVQDESDLDQLTTLPTKIDRIVYVRDPLAFHIPWDRIYKPGRLITLRFHSERKTAAAFMTLMRSLSQWRMSRKDVPVFVQIDEAYLGAASKISMRYSRAYMRSAEQTEIFMRGARGLSIACFVSTQRPFFVAAGARSQVSHIFSSFLGEKRDVETVEERLPPNTIDVNVVDTILKRSEIRTAPYFWFLWINLLDSKVNVIRPCLPPTGAEMANMTAWDQFHEYGLTYESWHEVPTLFKDIGTLENPLPVYEPFLPEKEYERKYMDRRRKGTPLKAAEIEEESLEEEEEEIEEEAEEDEEEERERGGRKLNLDNLPEEEKDAWKKVLDMDDNSIF